MKGLNDLNISNPINFSVNDDDVLWRDDDDNDRDDDDDDDNENAVQRRYEIVSYL